MEANKEEMVNNKEEGQVATKKKVVKKSSTKKTSSGVSAKTSKVVKEHPETTIAKSKEKAVKATVEKGKQLLLEEVVSQREVKYIYPEDCTDILAKKKFRQTVRNKINKFHAQLSKIGEKESKEYKKILKELNTFSRDFVKASAVV